MTWMNEYEINEIERMFSPEEFPNLSKGAEHLSQLRHWVNGHSDGWPYWGPPAKAAGKLMTVLQDARDTRWSLLDDISDDQLKKLIAPVEKFLTARGEDPYTVLNVPPPPPPRRSLSLTEAQELHQLLGGPIEAGGDGPSVTVELFVMERARELAAIIVADLEGS